ncbi:TIR domain-containing protein [Phthorimaea operculella]|nr:TIR domain-containing protein [Phthorimaea operculella]
MYCDDHVRMTYAFTAPNETLSFTEVFVSYCYPINTTYMLEFKALNINTSIIRSLTLKLKVKEALPPGNYTAGLPINFLSMWNDESFEYVFNNTPNFLEELANLKTMYVSDIIIPPLPMTMELVNLSLSHRASITDWGNCGHIERLDLIEMEKTNTSLPIWPQNCTKLKHLKIDFALPDIALMMTDRMMAAAPSIHTLKITHCRLHKLPIEMIKAAKNLVYLDLMSNMLYDELFLLFPYHATLKTLDLSKNHIKGYGLGSLVEKLPGLVELKLQFENNLISDCTSNLETNLRRKFIELLQNSSIEILDLAATDVQLDCFKAIQFKNLKRLAFSPIVPSSEDMNLKFMNLPRSTEGRLMIDISWQYGTTISFNEHDYDRLRLENSTNPHIYNSKLILEHVILTDCDCQNGWLARGIRDFPDMLMVPNILCVNDHRRPILKVAREDLECDLTDNRDRDGCTYRKSWNDGKVTAKCNLEGWKNIDNLLPLQGLNVSGQAVSTLHSTLPEMLQWLDLRHNRIARGNLEQATALFANGRRVWLDGNLLMCECDNWVFLDAIQRYHNQVQDYDKLKCAGTGEPLSSITKSALCQLAFVVSLSVCGVLVVIIKVLVVLLRRYGEQVRMFLYSRGWCISCLQKRDPDDKPYDAFISFAHEDQEYVMNTLLPGLENAPEQFRVCVHYRDWHVGDWIPAQIMRSVQLSKRTLIVLSRSFVASTWSTLELRYALANAAEEPSAKVLVLIRDDILDMDLDTELKKYITYNTYLTCDDPWFWEKLRYAMPHRAKSKTSGKIDAGVKVEEVNMDNVTERRSEGNTV